MSICLIFVFRVCCILFCLFASFHFDQNILFCSFASFHFDKMFCYEFTRGDYMVNEIIQGVGDDQHGWAADGVRHKFWHDGEMDVRWPREWRTLRTLITQTES